MNKLKKLISIQLKVRIVRVEKLVHRLISEEKINITPLKNIKNCYFRIDLVHNS